MTSNAEKRSNDSRNRWAKTFAGASLVAATSFLGSVGCTASTGGPESIGQTSSAITGGDALGFESPAGWTVSSGTVAATTTRTQGAEALAVTAPQNYTTLVSVPLASNLAGLAGLASTASTVSVDLELPTSQPNPNYFGALQLFVSAPAEGIYNQYLGQSLLTGQPLGGFQTYTFVVTSFVQTQLTNKTYSDLTFTLALNAPAG